MKYESFAAIDLDGVGEMIRAGLDPRLHDNKAMFGSLGPDFIANLDECAVSPFTGALVPPYQHFGIDSDPWMHAVLYKDGPRSFIVICQGMTSAGQLGAILLPRERLLLENRSSWYFRDVYENRIRRNLPRILNFFNWRARNLASTSPRDGKVLVCIGNERVGDYIMQMLWLSRVAAHPDFGRRFEVERLMINRASEFCDIGSLFEEFSEKSVKLNSIAHIEYHARHFRGALLSDTWPLSDKSARSDLRRRMDRVAKSKWMTPRLRAHLAELDNCPLRIWLSLELEKRVCRDQEAGLATVLRQLAETHLAPHEPIGLIFSGITGTVSGHVPSSLADVIATERKAAAAIAKNIGRNVILVVASGMNLGEKIVLADHADIVLAPIGSGSIVPSLLLQKPGVVYGYNITGYSAFAGDNTAVLDPRFLTKEPGLKGAVSRQTDDYVSYAVDWRAVKENVLSKFVYERDGRNRVSVHRRGTDA
jgi:hypothetical protein